MRGGFVACLDGNASELERVVADLRWHRGDPARYHAGRLQIAAFVDGTHGPTVEQQGSATCLVHGALPAPLRDLERSAQHFAAVEWDGATLRASRDPFGLVPIFYRVHRGSVWLATEVHPLVSLAPPGPDLECIVARAAFAPLENRTGWTDVRRILPGSTVEFGPNLVARGTHYWMPERILGTYRGSRSQAVAELRQRFTIAVRRCYELPSGILLSGGLDSSSVAATSPSMNRGLPHLVHVHYPDLPQTDEERYATAVAQAVGAPLHTVEGELTPWDIGAELDVHGIPYSWLPFGMDEPALSHLAARGITVALDGHDGDGVLGPEGAEWGELVLKGEARRLAELCRVYGARRVLRGLAADFIPPCCRPARYRSRTHMQPISRYFREPLKSRIVHDDIYVWRWPSIRWRMRQLKPLLSRTMESYEQKEIEAARYGIDLRHPFADRDLVEFLISLPCAIKADDGRKKSLLLDALGDDLPEVIRNRPKSDYMAAVGHRVDPARCLEGIRASKVQLPYLDYARLFDDGEMNPDGIPIFLIVNLARAHEVARRAM
jgi:asparagine synthase (glutamine-hydrolysing)